jgi:hypothetical protein
VTAAFSARRSLHGTVFFAVVLFATACLGLILVVSGETLGAWILGFGVVLEALVILQAVRPGWSYRIGPDGITVHRAVGTVVLRREEIASVEAVDGSRVEELVAGPPWAQVNAGKAMDIGAGIRARRELGRIVALCTAPVVFTQTSGRGSLHVRSVGARAPGRFVLVTLREGSVRALSPRDVDGFVAAWAAGPPGSAWRSAP